MAEELIQKYETARRDLLALWTAKQRLLIAAQSRFPKSYPVFKAIQRLCHNDPTRQIRLLADNSACRSADRYGDDLFRREVDGVRIPAVTHWFYGISDILPNERVPMDRTKTFRAAELERFEDVGRRARNFMESVSLLPFVSAKELTQEMKRFEQSYAKAQEQIERVSPLYASYLRLQERVPQSIAGNIVTLSGE